MISGFKSFVLPMALAASVAAIIGCAGGKRASSSSMESGTSGNQKLEDARRSAEDAEAKAHQLREEKNSSTAKTGK